MRRGLVCSLSLFFFFGANTILWTSFIDENRQNLIKTSTVFLSQCIALYYAMLWRIFYVP